MITINSDEHFRAAVCEERAGAAAGTKEQRDKPGASSYQPGNSGKQRGDVIAEPEPQRGRVNMTKSVCMISLKKKNGENPDHNNPE
ncbi:MAG: hypothetical protein WCH85_11635 [Methanomicrobiales archaeon]